MSWDCPHLYWYQKGFEKRNLCRLNGRDCSPGKGKCVLKGRFEISSADKTAASKQSEEKTD
ncbi:MAG: hypothetical protein GXO77_09130 [Calditrichaeota bacterium]|nr:hypothetical protein [Calditrichota bacterium]